MHLTNFHFYNFKNYLYSKPVKGLRGCGVGYSFSFNGQEKDDEVFGAGNTMTATFWEYDARLGRRWNLDPKPIAGISNYVCFANNPIALTDPFGDVVKPTGDKKDIKKFVKQISKATGNKYAIDKDGNLYNKLGVENTKTTKNKSAELGQIVKSAIEDKETFKLDLVNNDASVLIDNYNTGKVDVGDFAKMDRISQAGQFAHFLTERMENPGDYSIANRNDPNFLNIAHPKAMIAESKVVTAMLKIPYALGIQTQQPKTWKDVQGVEHHLVELRTTYGSAIFGVDVLTTSKRTNTSMTTYREDFEASGTFYSKYSRLK